MMSGNAAVYSPDLKSGSRGDGVGQEGRSDSFGFGHRQACSPRNREGDDEWKEALLTYVALIPVVTGVVIASGEQECLELRKERDKKEEQLNSVFSQVEANDAKVHCLKSTHSLETNKLRNVVKFFAHLLGTDALPWHV